MVTNGCLTANPIVDRWTVQKQTMIIGTEPTLNVNEYPIITIIYFFKNIFLFLLIIVG